MRSQPALIILALILSVPSAAQQQGGGNNIPLSLPITQDYIAVAHLTDVLGSGYYRVLSVANIRTGDDSTEATLDAAAIEIDSGLLGDKSSLVGSVKVPKLEAHGETEQERIAVPVALAYKPQVGDRKVVQLLTLEKPETLLAKIADLRVAHEGPRVTLQFWIYSQAKDSGANWVLQIGNVDTGSWDDVTFGRVEAGTSRIEYHGAEKTRAYLDDGDRFAARIKLVPDDEDLPVMESKPVVIKSRAKEFNPWRNSPIFPIF